MQLIDRDRLIRELDKKHYSMASRKQLYAQPIIEAVPVVRGTWTDDKSATNGMLFFDIPKCSVCGSNPGIMVGRANFCPWCGADMRGEDRIYGDRFD